MRCGLADTNLEEIEDKHFSTDTLARKSAESFLAAIMPLAQDVMVEMNGRDRACVMAWLSDPAPVAESMKMLVEMLLGSQETAEAVTEAALRMANNVEELQDVLQNFSRDDVLSELNQLREAVHSPPEAQARREERERNAHARRVAAVEHRARGVHAAAQRARRKVRGRRQRRWYNVRGVVGHISHVHIHADGAAALPVDIRHTLEARTARAVKIHDDAAAVAHSRRRSHGSKRWTLNLLPSHPGLGAYSIPCVARGTSRTSAMLLASAQLLKHLEMALSHADLIQDFPKLCKYERK